FQKKFALSCCSIPEVPANTTEPAVGANQVGAPVPPEMRACPVVPAAETSAESESVQRIPPWTTVRFLFVPPFASGNTPATSAVARSTALVVLPDPMKIL